MFTTLKEMKYRVQNELKVYQLVLKDERTPRFSKLLLGMAVGYALSPVDMIPDFIPIIGHLDDVVIIPGLVYLALHWIPNEIVEDCRSRVKEGLKAPLQGQLNKPKSRLKRL